MIDPDIDSSYSIHRLRRGARVKMTEFGISQGIQGRSTRGRRGTYFGTTRNRWGRGFYVRVKRDGIKNTETYHPIFWEPA